MAIPAWKLQLQQNIAKKKSEKQKQDEQRRIQMLPPWKRAAIEQQSQSKNVIIIPNSSINNSKTASDVVSNSSTAKTVITNAHTTNTKNVNTVNANNQTSPSRTVSIVTANQKSPTRNVTIKTNSGNNTSGSVSSTNRVPLKQAGKSKSVDVSGSNKANLVSSKSFDRTDTDSDGEVGVSDEHCISVHNNPFLRREKKTGGLGKPNFSNGAHQGLGNRQKVQDSNSPTATSTAPRVAWNSKSESNDGSLQKSSNNNTSPTKNNYIIKKQKQNDIGDESKSSERSSRSTERKLSVHDIMMQFGRAASQEEKQRVRRQGSMEEPLSPTSPRSVSTHARDYSTRQRSPSPIKNRYRSAPSSKPRPKSSPVEISTSVILSQGRRSPATSPQPVRRTAYGANREKAQAPSAPSGSKKVVINTSTAGNKQSAPKAPAPSVTVTSKKQEPPAPKIAINDKLPAGKTPVTNGSPRGAVLLNKKHLVAYDTHDAGRTPPPRRKTPLPASAIIDLNTAGPIQEASGKPPVDPEIIAKEKAASIPKDTQKSGTNAQSRNVKSNDVENPKPNTVSSLMGAFSQNKPKAPSPLATSVKSGSPVESIPYPEDFRRPKSWQAKQEEERNLPSQSNLRQTAPIDTEKERNEKNASISHTPTEKPVDISPIPRTSSEKVSPIPKTEQASPIPNREIISSDTKPATQNGHVDSTTLPQTKAGKGEASQEMMDKARAIKKVKKKVNYEVIGGNAPTGKPSAQMSKSGRNRNKSKLVLTFRDEPEEYEYQSEQSLMAEYGDEQGEDEDDGRHSSVSEDEEPSPAAPAPSGFRDNVPKGTGGLQSYTPSYLRDLTPSSMREYQEATRRKEETPKVSEPESTPFDAGDDFSSASSAAMLF